MAHLIDLYHHLPYPLKIAAASLRGYQLRWWRYGRETDWMVEEALEREHWSAGQWQVWQENRLAFILERAARQVPYYREQWQARRRSGDRASWAYLENWPILEKDDLHNQNEAFVAEDCNTKKMFHDHTSGTSGKLVNIWLNRMSVQGWYALHEARALRWNGLTRHDRWGMIGGQLVASFNQTKPPFWVWNAGLKQLYMSAYHLAEKFMPDYLDAIRRHQVNYLLGYSSSLYTLATFIQRKKINSLKLKAVIANAEPIYPYQKQVMESAFDCPVLETYGVAETVAAANECEHGRLHLWLEAGYQELSSPITETDGAVTGELVSTGLFNSDMPLIRYRVGDIVSLANKGETCPCGRSLPIIRSIDGRSDDLLLTTDGRWIARLTPIFQMNMHIKEAQIIQEQLNRVKVKFVPDPEFTSNDADDLVERIHQRLGNMEVELEFVDQIPREPNGKFRTVICKLPEDLRPVGKL